jgi:hypothetical protein
MRIGPYNCTSDVVHANHWITAFPQQADQEQR